MLAVNIVSFGGGNKEKRSCLRCFYLSKYLDALREMIKGGHGHFKIISQSKTA